MKKLGSVPAKQCKQMTSCLSVAKLRHHWVWGFPIGLPKCHGCWSDLGSNNKRMSTVMGHLDHSPPHAGMFPLYCMRVRYFGIIFVWWCKAMPILFVKIAVHHSMGIWNIHLISDMDCNFNRSFWKLYHVNVSNPAYVVRVQELFWQFCVASGGKFIAYLG